MYNFSLRSLPPSPKRMKSSAKAYCCQYLRYPWLLRPFLLRLEYSFPALLYLFEEILICRSQWPRGLSHRLPSLSQTLGSWIRMPLKRWMSVECAFILCVGRGLPAVYRIKKLKKRSRPNKGLYSHNNNNNNKL
jgi:hypothetical protein